MKRSPSLERSESGEAVLLLPPLKAVSRNEDVNQERRHLELKCLGTWRENYKHRWLLLLRAKESFDVMLVKEAQLRWRNLYPGPS